MNNYTLKLKEYGIDRELYLELKYFCRQYPKKLEQVRGAYDLKAAQITGMPHSPMSGDSVGAIVARCESLSRDLGAIDKAAMTAEPDLFAYMLKHVTEGIGFGRLGCPCSVETFKRARRRFYWNLARNLNKI